MVDSPSSKERIFRGIAVSPGVRQAKVIVIGKTDDVLPSYAISEAEVSTEMERLESALVRTRQQIVDVQRKVSEAMGADDASIFDAHLLVLEDRTLLDEVMRVISKERINVERAFHKVAEKYAATLSSIDDDYLRERATDMRDVTGRVVNNLLGRQSKNELSQLQEPCIVVSHDLSPSTTAMLDRNMVLGFATDVGSKTSHTAIMARSLRIPAVVALRDASHQLESGAHGLIDGYNGVLIVHPSDQTLFEYGQLVRKQLHLEEKLLDAHDKPAVTADGLRVVLSANVEQVTDTAAVQASGAEGVGLFRTEFLFLNRHTLPTEEEQYEAYRQVAAALKPDPVVIRTLDLGGDKFLSHLEVPQEMNPFLGWRAIRFCLQERDIFRSHIRAVLRASVEGNVKLMYPMISCLKELDDANALVELCKAELRAEGIGFDENLEIGLMIEIPSAVMIADCLAKRAKFFSIGTNDLIQYTLAVDRLNEKIAHLYQPTHPAIVQLLKMTVDAAHRNGIWAGVCGEMAGDPVMTPLLLGLGIDELSATPTVVPKIKYLIRRLNAGAARELAEWALKCESGEDILERCQRLARETAPALFE